MVGCAHIVAPQRRVEVEVRSLHTRDLLHPWLAAQANAKTKSAVKEWLEAIEDDVSIAETVKSPIQRVVAVLLKDGTKCATKHIGTEIVIEYLDRILAWPSERLEELVLVVSGWRDGSV